MTAVRKYTKVLPQETRRSATIRTDIASFSGSGFGTMPVPAGISLSKGDQFAITDDEADTLRAEVVSDPVDGQVAVQIYWDDILEYAE
jgi:hypothetical protein